MGVTAIERAFDLARSGMVAGIEDIRANLKKEGYSPSAIEGRTLHKQLRALISAARAKNALLT
jgi:hypothetical protein